MGARRLQRAAELLEDAAASRPVAELERLSAAVDQHFTTAREFFKRIS